MVGTWWFGLQQAGSKRRDPTQGEYFGTSADSVVRESIQNSLDAGIEGCQVRVRIHVSETGLDMTGQLRSLFSDLEPHLDASAVHSHVVSSLPERCRYLVVEDFGTKGLIGDPGECFDETVGKNFYSFFRAEGRGTKSSGDRGSWGYGKYTFVKASTANCFFAITVPSDGGSASALGQAVLSNHRVGPRNYQPDGWWATVTSDRDLGEIPRPFLPGSPQYAAIENLFGLSRTTETGLSVVVPFLDEDITAQAVLAAVVENYLPSIVMDDLVVELTSDLVDAVEINRSTIRDVIAGSELLAEQTPLLEMSERLSRPPDLTLAHVASEPSWRDYQLLKEEAEWIEERLEGDDPFVVRLALCVKPKAGEEQESFFDVCYTPARDRREKASFFRRGIRVSDAGNRALVRARAVVSVNDQPLARMLGLAENPSHTNWSASTDRFRGKYTNGQRWIGFVRSAPNELLDLASKGRPMEDRRALSSFFPATSEIERRGKSPGDRDDGDSSGTPNVGADKPLVPVVIGPYRSNGFRVRFTEDAPVGEEVDVIMAYDTLRGNPFVKWTPQDFDVADLAIEEYDLEALDRSGQRVRVKIGSVDAELCITGFDRWLDVIVRCEGAT